MPDHISWTSVMKYSPTILELVKPMTSSVVSYSTKYNRLNFDWTTKGWNRRPWFHNFPLIAQLKMILLRTRTGDVFMYSNESIDRLWMTVSSISEEPYRGRVLVQPHSILVGKYDMGCVVTWPLFCPSPSLNAHARLLMISPDWKVGTLRFVVISFLGNCFNFSCSLNLMMPRHIVCYFVDAVI